MSEIAISVQAVSKHFRLHSRAKQNRIKDIFVNALKFRSANEKDFSQQVLKDVSFNVNKGEFFGIVGRNGSGKSTMLKMLASIYQPNSGSIKINGRLVPFIELGVGFNPNLTGRENVYLNGALMGFSDSEIDKKYNSIVEFAELEKFMDEKLNNYSSGMQVRLAFSVATILADSEILLIDEVLAVGDASFQRKCYEYFKKLKNNKKTVVFISHDMQAVREYCDRAMLIDEGKIIEIGDVDKVSQSYTKLFMNEIIDDNETVDVDSEKWGDGSATYSNPKVDISESLITVKATVKARTDIDDLVLGFTVSALDGDDVMGTNTRIKDKIIRNVLKGEQYEIQWKFPNILEDGKYSVALTAHGTSGLPVYEWWNHAVAMKIRKYEKTGYQVNPEIKLSLSKVK